MYTAVHCINGKYVMYAIQSHAIRLRSDMNMCVTMNISRCVCVCIIHRTRKRVRELCAFRCYCMCMTHRHAAAIATFTYYMLRHYTLGMKWWIFYGNKNICAHIHTYGSLVGSSFFTPCFNISPICVRVRLFFVAISDRIYVITDGLFLFFFEK